RQTLLIFDNCEHLIDGVASTARELLQGCPELHILATSREPLGVDGEVVYRLNPLDTPTVNAAAKELRDTAAVQLFVDRAAASRPGFALDAGNRVSVAHICRSVDGIPLAIELAAARLHSMSCEELASHMDSQIDILTGGQRTALPRHQTLKAAMDVSYKLLKEADRVLLRCTCVFRGGFSLEDVAQICDDEPESAVRDGLSRLVVASLVVAEERRGATRYRQLEPVRQFSAELLRETGEDHVVRYRHAAWFAKKAAVIAEQAEAGQMDRVLEIGLHDRENFREALRWTVDAEEAGLALTLASGLGPFWRAAGPKAEGHAWLEAVLALSPDAVSAEQFHALEFTIQFGIACSEPVDARLDEFDRLAEMLGRSEPQARALYLRGAHAWSRGDLTGAINLIEESCRLTEADGGPLSRARVLLTECLIRVGRFDESEQMLTELTRWDEREGRTRDYGLVENLGMTLYARGDLEEAERLVEEAVKGYGRRGSRSNQMEAMSYLAWITIDLGKVRRTRMLAERALAMAREDSEVMIEANSLWVLGRLALREGDTAGARELLAECLRVAGRRRERIVLALALHACADLANIEGDQERAVRLFGAADHHLRAISQIMPRSIGDDYDRALADLRLSLGDRVWEAARDAGREMSLDDAIGLALKPSGTEAGDP
ncbi:MAG: tetratricopeptide repeat protein, partial [Actinomycetota bacterium]